MRVAIASLALVVSACAFGGGVGPSTQPPTSAATTVAGTTSTTDPLDPLARAAALATARAFLDALGGGEWEAAVAMVADPPSDLAETLASWWDDLALTSLAYSIAGDVVASDRAVVGISATLIPLGFEPWRFETEIGLVAADGWQVLWSPSILYPGLTEGDRLVVEREWRERGAILARDGAPLATTVPTWTIGVIPGQVDDLEALITVLEETAGVPGETIRTEMAKPGIQPDWFVPVGVIPASRADAVTILEGTTGVALRAATGRELADADSAVHVVGTVGPMTAERLTDLGAPYGPTDQVGLSGIERAYERRLAGTPDARIVQVNRYGRVVDILAEAAGEMPQDVTTTIDVTVQKAAERALADITKPAAVVILDTETSEVLASVSWPQDGFDRAFLGTYPPGSSFKIVTLAALLQNGMGAYDQVPCPAEVILGGARFPNAGGRDLGSITLAKAFAESCNTTFTAMAVEHLSATLLGAVAGAFGFDVSPDAGLPAATPRFPDPVDTAELAASAMGQGRVLVTPLQQAAIAAAIASDGWIPPTVISGSNRVRIPLDPGVAADVAELMLLVVTEGTGERAQVAGEVVRGKTGSGEFNDSGDTHAWFVGYWDHLAIAVIVEDGGSGGETAAPIAAAIIRNLAGIDG